jgi:hypothetical protein
MKSKAILGLVLLIAGFFGLARPGFSYASHGPMLTQTVPSDEAPLAPALGAMGMFAGFILIAWDDGRREQMIGVPVKMNRLFARNFAHRLKRSSPTLTP